MAQGQLSNLHRLSIQYGTAKCVNLEVYSVTAAVKARKCVITIKFAVVRVCK
jgi:hypothetical protein